MKLHLSNDVLRFDSNKKLNIENNYDKPFKRYFDDIYWGYYFESRLCTHKTGVMLKKYSTGFVPMMSLFHPEKRFIHHGSMNEGVSSPT